MSFWIPASLLALAAVGFALAPFLRRGREPHSRERGVDERDGLVPVDASNPVRGSDTTRDRARVLRALYRQRLGELEDETAAGILDESSRSEVEQELGQGLLDGFATLGRATGGTGAAGERLDSQGADSSRPGVGRETTGAAAEEAEEKEAIVAAGESQRRPWTRPVLLLTAVAIPVLALSVYLEVGEPDAQVLREAAVVLQLDPERNRLELDRWRVLLADRLDRIPDDAQSRYLLGRIYLKDGEYKGAAESFAQAHAIVGDDPSIDLVWLQALYLAGAGRLGDQAMSIAERILKRAPSQPLVLEMLAIDAYRGGDFGESVGLFSRALGNTLEPMQRTALELFLKQARSMLGDAGPGIDVRLNAVEAPPASATLFVIARPVGGGMPFAVVRRAAVPLPEVVRLDDAVSMNPALPLSAADEIEVVARISLTGAAVSHPGDWEWRSQPLSVTAAQILALNANLGPPERSE